MRFASRTSGLVAEIPSNGARQLSMSSFLSGSCNSQRSIRLGPASARKSWIGYPLSAEWMLRYRLFPKHVIDRLQDRRARTERVGERYRIEFQAGIDKLFFQASAAGVEFARR